MKKLFTFTGISILVGLLTFGAACNSGLKPTTERPIPGKSIASGPIGDKLNVTISNESGTLKVGDQEIWLSFTDTTGKTVDAGAVNAAALMFHMPGMGSMAAMNNSTAFSTTSVPGVYKGTVRIEMAGEWQAQITFEGAAGNGKTVLPVSAQ